MRTYEHAGPVLQELLRAGGLTVEALAETTGIDVRTLRRILDGRQKSISTRNLVGIARCFDISLMELIDRFS